MINTLLEEVTSQAVSGINEDVVQKHGETIMGTKQLEPDETIRLVIMPGANSKIAQSAEFKKTTGAWTDKNQIRNAQELIARMRTISLGNSWSYWICIICWCLQFCSTYYSKL